MIIPSFPPLALLLLVIWCAFSTVLGAYDPTTRRKPQGPLGVALDFSFANNWPRELSNSDTQTPRNWMWSSHITFKYPVSAITDGQLWQIATDAYKEIPADMNQYGISVNKHQPGALTILAFGNEIILASSQRGQPSYTYNYANTDVLESLKLCQIIWKDNGPDDSSTDKQHANRGQCGEVIAAHLYYSIYTTPLKERQARIGTVVSRGGEMRFFPPCGNPEKVSEITLRRLSQQD